MRSNTPCSTKRARKFAVDRDAHIKVSRLCILAVVEDALAQAAIEKRVLDNAGDEEEPFPAHPVQRGRCWGREGRTSVRGGEELLHGLQGWQVVLILVLVLPHPCLRTAGRVVAHEVSEIRHKLPPRQIVHAGDVPAQTANNGGYIRMWAVAVATVGQPPSENAARVVSVVTAVCSPITLAQTPLAACCPGALGYRRQFLELPLALKAAVSQQSLSLRRWVHRSPLLRIRPLDSILGAHAALTHDRWSPLALLPANALPGPISPESRDTLALVA